MKRSIDMKYNISDDEFVKIVNESDTMLKAAESLGMPFMTFRHRAKKLNVYKPNQSRKGIKRTVREKEGLAIPLNEILEGKHPQYQTTKLKNRLVRTETKEDRCEECGITEWNGKPVVIELHHIDGDSTNHKYDNLKLLCPNCHSQTPQYSGRS